MNKKDNTQDSLRKLMADSLDDAIEKQFPGFRTQTSKSKEVKPDLTPVGLNEAIITIPKNFVLKTETLSQITKENHFKLYNQYSKDFNDISVKLDVGAKNNISAINPYGIPSRFTADK